MRDSYHERLDQIGEGLVRMSKLAADAVGDATTALLDADLQAAERVIAGDNAINELHHHLDSEAFDLMARQQPVASDLRALVTSTRMASELERAGDYAVHVAKVARRRYPSAVVPADLQDVVRRMGDLTAQVTRKAGDVIATRDLSLAAELHAQDDDIDALHKQLFRALLDQRGYEVEAVIDVTLVGRYLERLADHAVSVAAAVSYLVTGAHAELDDPERTS